MTSGLGSKKWLKDLFFDIIRNTAAIIFYRNFSIQPFRFFVADNYFRLIVKNRQPEKAK